MTHEEFTSYYGMTPERARQILTELRHIVNREVHEVIAHADYYIDPRPYGYEGVLEKENGEDDGYTCLYDFGNLSGGAVNAFMQLISFHTTHGGHTSAIRACELMGLVWEGDK